MLSAQSPDSEFFEEIYRLFAPLGKRACPIYGRGRRGFELIGTGVPIRDQRYAALLTAGHVLNTLDNGHIVVGGSQSFLRFRAHIVKFTPAPSPPAVDVDVAAVALSTEAVDELNEFYEFTGPSELSDFDEYNKLTLYGFVGCPETRNRSEWHKRNTRNANSYFYVVREYGELLTTGRKSAVTHVAFQAPLRSAAGAEGIQTAPDPHGISGCGVWKIKLDEKTGQNTRPELVGIGIEYSKGVFIATRIGAAAVAVGKLWKNLDHRKIGIEKLELHDGRTS